MSVTRPTWSHAPYLAALRKAADEVQRSRGWDHNLICRTGQHMDCAVLKLQKAAWTNDDLTAMGNQTGVFFSIWVSDQGTRIERAEYNIHALQLRKIDNHRLTSKAFASAFRSEFAASAGEWPNVRTDFGPLTLMQGHMPSDINQLSARTVDLITKFKPLVGLIDRLYANHRRRS